MKGIPSIVSTLLVSTMAFISTELDEFILLLILFMRCSSKRQIVFVSAGKYLALILIGFCSYFFSSYLLKIPGEYVGFLGFIPVVLGLKELLKKSQKPEEGQIQSQCSESSGKDISILITSFFISLGSSGDNFAVYIPLFTSFRVGDFLICGIIFSILQFAMLILAEKAVNLSVIQNTIKKIGHILIPVLLISLGIYILWKNGTFALASRLIRGD